MAAVHLGASHGVSGLYVSCNADRTRGFSPMLSAQRSGCAMPFMPLLYVAAYRKIMLPEGVYRIRECSVS